MQKVILKNDPARSIKNRHHWIFSRAIKKLPRHFHDGDILAVYDEDNNFLGIGYFNTQAPQLSGRMLSFASDDLETILSESIESAFQLRQQQFQSTETNTYRLINGEGDNLPGLVVDRYADTLVMQISTLGIDKLKTIIVKLLRNITGIEHIYENSDLNSRRQEGLKPAVGWLTAASDTKINVLENNIHFQVDIANSHKTGLYLDQREMRAQIYELTKRQNLQSVLNCFSYTGGFSLYAASAGAETTSVDISQDVITQAKTNFELNGLDKNKHSFVAQDVFDFLRDAQTLDYDLVILDPPAFAKKKQDVKKAFNAYKQINRLAMQKLKPGSFLLTASCSYHMQSELFQKMLFQAATSMERRVRIVGKHIHAADHPLNIFNPEQDYLKSFLLRLD